jgi:glutathione S-transferase
MTSDDLPESAAATAAPAPAVVATEAAAAAATEASPAPAAPRLVRPALRPSDILWDHKNWRISGSVGETTIRQHTNLLRPELYFYASFSCPLSQIVWIVLEEYRVKYKWIEVRKAFDFLLSLLGTIRTNRLTFPPMCVTTQHNTTQQIYPYEVNETRPGGYTRQKLSTDRLLMQDSPLADFVQTISPRGVLPAIRQPGSTTTKNDDPKGSADDMVVWGALAAAEYVELVFGGRRRRSRNNNSRLGDGDDDEIIPPLLPNDNDDRVRVQMWCHHIVYHIYPCFERAVSEPPQQAESLWDVCLDECRAVAMAMMSSNEGPFFLGRQFSLVDVTFAPLWQRILWLQHGTTTTAAAAAATTDNEPAWRHRITIWWRAVAARPSVSATLISKPRLQAFYYHNDNSGGRSSNNDDDDDDDGGANVLS